MNNPNRDKGKQPASLSEAATQFTSRVGDFPLGSLESRAAARSEVERRKKAGKVRFIMCIPRPPWAPPWEECKGGDIVPVFTDDPEVSGGGTNG
jgi:hypothetical protein